MNAGLPISASITMADQIALTEYHLAVANALRNAYSG